MQYNVLKNIDICNILILYIHIEQLNHIDTMLMARTPPVSPTKDGTAGLLHYQWTLSWEVLRSIQ